MKRSRVVRGGAFWDDPLDARCAYRADGTARATSTPALGFAVVVAPMPLTSDL